MSHIASMTDFTALSAGVKDELHRNFKGIRSSAEAEALIKEFIAAPADGKGDLEREIATLLSDCDGFTGYAADHGDSPICTAIDRQDGEKVRAAAEEYRRYAAKLPGKEEFDRLFFLQFYELYKASRSSVDYMERLVRRRMRVISPELYSDGDPVRLMILKQYLKQMEYKNAPGLLSKDLVRAAAARSGSESLDEKAVAALDDGFFEEIFALIDGEKNRDRKKRLREVYHPLILADDIAGGNFDNQLTIRRHLYVFAIIFELTFFLKEERGEVYMEDTDVEKNLFRDYYTDNLITALENKSRSGIGREPSGHGINFKNFAEVIYLYYLRAPLSPRERLIRAEKMIARCTSASEDLETQKKLYGYRDTWFYRDNLIARMMTGTEAELEDAIRGNYIRGRAGASVIRAAEEDISANDIYSVMVDIFIGQLMIDGGVFLIPTADVEDAVYKDYLHREYCRGSCASCKNGGKAYPDCPDFTDDCLDYARSHYSSAEFRERFNKRLGTKRRDMTLAGTLPGLESLRSIITDGVKNSPELAGDADFMGVLEVIRDRLTVSGSRGELNEIIRRDFAEGKASRTKLMVLYYFIFVLQYSAETDLDGRAASGSFTEFFDEFCNTFEIEIFEDEPYYGLNELLAAAGYQTVSPKNLFDMFIVFHAYKIHRLEDDVAGSCHE